MASGKKCIFITGAASGIGRATARLFAEKGWYVGLFDVNSRGLKSLGIELGPDKCCYRIMDVSSKKSVLEGVKYFTKKTGGRMDILFNNAGIIHMGLSESIKIENEFRIIDVNLKGTLNCIHAALPLLKKTGQSRIINMSSASSLYGTAYLAVYSATKAALGSLTESLNLELEQHGIFVSDVRAPFVKTPLLERDVKAPCIDSLGIHLAPEDIAKTVWKSSRGRSIHNDSKGVKPLMLLLKIPSFLRMPIIRFLLMPK